MAKILVIDDESTIVMVLEQILDFAGYEVFTAANGLEGIDLLEEGLQPDLLIIDLLMPGMGGKEFLNVFHTDYRLTKIKVLLLTGSIPNERDFPSEDLYHDIICKPFNIDNILSTVERLLNSVE